MMYVSIAMVTMGLIVSLHERICVVYENSYTSPPLWKFQFPPQLI